MSTTITGDCSLCGEPVNIVDGVWPPGHGSGKCAPTSPAATDVGRGATSAIPIDDLFEGDEQP